MDKVTDVIIMGERGRNFNHMITARRADFVDGDGNPCFWYRHTIYSLDRWGNLFSINGGRRYTLMIDAMVVAETHETVEEESK